MLDTCDPFQSLCGVIRPLQVSPAGGASDRVEGHHADDNEPAASTFKDAIPTAPKISSCLRDPTAVSTILAWCQARKVCLSRPVGPSASLATGWAIAPVLEPTFPSLRPIPKTDDRSSLSRLRSARHGRLADRKHSSFAGSPRAGDCYRGYPPRPACQPGKIHLPERWKLSRPPTRLPFRRAPS